MTTTLENTPRANAPSVLEDRFTKMHSSWSGNLGPIETAKFLTQLNRVLADGEFRRKLDHVQTNAVGSMRVSLRETLQFAAKGVQTLRVVHIERKGRRTFIDEFVLTVTPRQVLLNRNASEAPAQGTTHKGTCSVQLFHLTKMDKEIRSEAPHGTPAAALIALLKALRKADLVEIQSVNSALKLPSQMLIGIALLGMVQVGAEGEMPTSGPSDFVQESIENPAATWETLDLIL